MKLISKVVMAMFSLVLLFACGGGSETAPMVSDQSKVTDGRARALAAGIAPDSGDLSSAINTSFAQCTIQPWEKIPYYRPDLKYADCVGKAYRVLFDRSGVLQQLLDTSSGHRWIPEKGRMVISVVNNFIIIEFVLDSTAIQFFEKKFINSNARLPIGLEIDISPTENDVFHKKCAVFGLNIPNDAGLFTDTTAYDWHPGCGAVIRNPHKLVAGTKYAVAFYADGISYRAPWQGATLIQESGPVVLNFQVSVDKALANEMIYAYDKGDHQLSGFPNTSSSSGSFQYFVAESDPFNPLDIPSHSRICWYGKSGDDVDCDGGNPVQQTTAANVEANGGGISDSLISSGAATFAQGSAFIPGQGPGGYPVLTDTPTSAPPDFVVNSVWLTDATGAERYTYGLSESFNTKAQAKNDGTGSCLSGEPTTITGHFYLSKGYKEDPHSGTGAWRRIDSTTTQCSNLGPGVTNTETKNTVIKQWITEPGVYNIVYCIDHPQDDHNNGGQHQEKYESNNCSTEAVFTVTRRSAKERKKFLRTLNQIIND